MRKWKIAARRCLSGVLIAAQILGLAGGLALLMPLPASASLTCATPGKDSAAGTISTTVNSYYKGTASASAGATSISVSSAPLGVGASTAIASGDLLLVVQISGATISTTNTSAYGSNGSSGNGWTNLNNVGKYEYVKATSAVVSNSVSIAGTGGGGGLVNAYTYSSSSASPAAFEVVRVPQYTTATLSSSSTGGIWQFYNGGGGIIAIDVRDTLTLGGTVSMSGQGFAAGGAYSAVTLSSTNNDGYVLGSTSSSTNTSEGSKGEGIAGAPWFTQQYSTSGSAGTLENFGSDFIPGGGIQAGSPGNAGGGGDEAGSGSIGTGVSGGGGGSNGGGGGNGTIDKHTVTPPAGKGGSALSPSVTFVALGGGGGGAAGSAISNTTVAGGSGGGMVFIRANALSGSGTISVNGITAPAQTASGGGNVAGGGGAGGTVMVTTPSGSLSGLTVNANGGAGGNASVSASNDFVGAGGGGGGGAILLSGSATSTSASGGAAGTLGTSGSTDTFTAAQAGGSGVTSTSITPSSIPGVSSGAECAAAQFAGNGPVGGNAAVGSYDGSVAVNNNDDFTAVSFVPASANFTNSSTTAGTPTGNSLGGPTTVNVPNEVDYTEAAGAGGTLTLTGTAPASPSGWTMRLCPDSGSNSPSCATTSLWTTVGAAGASPSSTLTLTAGQHLSSYKYWAVYSAPSGVTAYTRYHANIHGSDGTLSNDTHNELYPGFAPLTKSVTVSSTGCPAGVTPAAGQTCPGGVLLYTIDYRNIVAGGAASGSTEPESAFPETAAGTLVLTENGSYLSNTNGLKETLVAGANGTSTFGDSTANSTFTGNTVASTSFTDTVGGASFKLVPSGFTGTNKGQQGTFTFRVVVK